MKTWLLLLLLFATLPGFSQSISFDPGTTRAVIIGISDYQDPGIPDLLYAHKDAQAFAAYLQSPAGGSLPDENIRLLINQQATMAAIAGELDWLVEASGENDIAIIYFAGHGDVEAKTARQPGFLLAYDSPSKIYIAGAYPLFYLQLIIETLSTDKNVQTIVITDACRAGKLAGSKIGGAQATASNLARQYANEVKILSCQPDEYSLEGRQWGGGRGAFSYHLVEGLTGLADKNADRQVSLLELENYLEDMVPAETAPQSQIPMAVGNKGTLVALVDSDILSGLISRKEKQLPALEAIASRGIEESLLADVDSALQKKYEAFIAALDSKNLLDAQDGQPSADGLYRELREEESLASLHRLMARKFATALQDGAQQAINAYLLANPTELEKRWKGDTAYSQYPRYLGRAAELLGESHYMHDYLVAKQLYFEGLNLRLQIDHGNAVRSYEEAAEKQEAALKLESRAAYIYNELGVLHTRLKLGERAIAYYEKAIELAPEWGLPYVNLCLEQFYNNDTEQAMQAGEKAVELMPDYPQLYNLLGWVNANPYEKIHDMRNWEREGVELKEDFFYRKDNRSTLSEMKIKLEKTVQFLEKAISLDTTYASAYSNLGKTLSQMGSWDEAAYYSERSIRIDSTNDIAFLNFSRVLRQQSKFEEAEAAVQKAIELAKAHAPDRVCWWYNDSGITYRIWGKEGKALEAFQKAIELCPHYGYPYSNAAGIYASGKDFQKAEWHYLKYLEVYSAAPEAYLEAGQFYQSMNRFEDAERMYIKAIEKLPGYVRAINQLIKLYQEKGDSKSASEWEEKLLEVAPNDYLARLNAGKSAYKRKQYGQAETHFKKLVELDTANWRYLNFVGFFYRIHSEYELAEKYLRTVLEMDSSNTSATWNLAWVLFSTERKPEAFELLDKCIELQLSTDKKAELTCLKGLFRYYSGQPEESLEWFGEAAGLDEKYASLAQAVEKVIGSDFSAASICFEAAMEKNPGSDNIKYMFCQLKAEQGDHAGALGLLEKALELRGRTYDLVANDPKLKPLRELFRYQELMRRNFPEKFDGPDTSEPSAKEALYYPDNCVMLAKYYEKQQEWDRANSLYEKAIALKPDTPSNEMALSLAEAYLKLGRMEEARAICPDSISTHYRWEYLEAAKIFHRVQKTEQAEALVQRAIAMDPAMAYESTCLMGAFYTSCGDYKRAEQYLNLSIGEKKDYAAPYVSFASLYLSFDQPEKMMAILERGRAGNPNDKTLRELEVILSYFAYPPQEAKAKFDEAARLEPAFRQAWEYLELIRQKEFSKATLAWKAFEGKVSTAFILHTYLGALAQSGELEAAIALLEESPAYALPYQLLRAYPLLEPMRKEPAFNDYLLRHFLMDSK
ncbi:MAG: tetratricopeptide repeat protein [Lewinellaceae bacterium]|nr:tetratricopeptide repeat protein [Lewinellaceae bacterium]